MTPPWLLALSAFLVGTSVGGSLTLYLLRPWLRPTDWFFARVERAAHSGRVMLVQVEPKGPGRLLVRTLMLDAPPIAAAIREDRPVTFWVKSWSTRPEIEVYDTDPPAGPQEK